MSLSGNRKNFGWPVKYDLLNLHISSSEEREHLQCFQFTPHYQRRIKMELFAKIVIGFQTLTIFVKISILVFDCVLIAPLIASEWFWKFSGSYTLEASLQLSNFFFRMNFSMRI